jgi:hypothetical protein
LEHTEKSAAGVDEATSADMHGAINLHSQSEKQDAPTIFFPVRRYDGLFPLRLSESIYMSHVQTLEK